MPDIEAPSLRRALSKAQAQAVAAKLKSRLIEAPPPMQRRYIHGLVSEILVDREKAVISGPKAAIATAIAAQALDGEVHTFVREWRTGQGSNSRPPAFPFRHVQLSYKCERIDVAQRGTQPARSPS